MGDQGFVQGGGEGGCDIDGGGGGRRRRRRGKQGRDGAGERFSRGWRRRRGRGFAEVAGGDAVEAEERCAISLGGGVGAEIERRAEFPVEHGCCVHDVFVFGFQVFQGSSGLIDGDGGGFGGAGALGPGLAGLCVLPVVFQGPECSFVIGLEAE